MYFTYFALPLHTKYTLFIFMEEKNLNLGEEKKSLSFVEQFVKEDLEAGKNGSRLAITIVKAMAKAVPTIYIPENSRSSRIMARACLKYLISFIS